MAFIEVEPQEPWRIFVEALDELLHPTFPPGGAGIIDRLGAWFAAGPVDGNQHLTPIVAGTKLTPPDFATSALISVTVQDCHVSFAGPPASAVNGLYVAAGTILKLAGRETILGFSALQVVAGAVLDVVYFT